MIITGLRADDSIIDGTPTEPKTYKVKHIDNIIVDGRLEVRFWMEGEGFKETRTISSDEVVVLKISDEGDYKTMIVVSRDQKSMEAEREGTALVIATRRHLVDKVNTINLDAFDKKYGTQPPYKT